MKTKHPIRGILQIDHPFYVNVYRLSESGNMELLDDHINMRIGPLYYRISNIRSIKNIMPRKWNIESWIRIEGLINNKTRFIYIRDYKYFGLYAILFKGNQKLIKMLKQFQSKQSLRI